MKTLFKNREFDPDGLETVLAHIFIPIIVIGIFISMICFQKFWAIVVLLGFAFGIVYGIVHGIWKAFNLIFPKKEEY